MKKIVLGALLIFTLTPIKAQSNYTCIGSNDWPPHCIWKINVSDGHNNQPMPNIKVELLNENYLYSSAITNDEGVAIFLVYEYSKIRNGMTLKVYDSVHEYNSWEMEINQYDYYKSKINKKLLMWNSKGESVDFNFVKASTYDIVQAINNRKYQILTKRDEELQRINWTGPGWFEYNVTLSYAGKHPKEQQYHNFNRGGNVPTNRSERYNDNSYSQNRSSSNDNYKNTSASDKYIPELGCRESDIRRILGGEGQNASVILKGPRDRSEWELVEGFSGQISFSMLQLSVDLDAKEPLAITKMVSKTIPAGGKARLLYFVDKGEGNYGIMLLATKEKLRKGENIRDAYYSTVICDPDSPKKNGLMALPFTKEIPAGYYISLLAFSEDSPLDFRLLMDITDK